MVRFAGVEGGGTTWVAVISENDPSNIIHREEFKTESNPEDTLSKIKKWLMEYEFDSIGIASFGPIDPKPSSPKFGYITSTPKPGWKDTNVLKLLGLKDEFKDKPFMFDTDVNAPALAEYNIRSKTNINISSSAYITVGTGVGVGLVINGKSVHGLLHPEGGHLLVQKLPQDQDFLGTCPFHGCCIEGMCSTGALIKRMNCHTHDLPQLPDDDELWNITAFYIAQLCINLILISSIESISIGGGVLNRSILYPLIRKHVIKLLAGYIENENLMIEKIDTFITPPIYGSDAGIIGAAYLGQIAYENAHHK